MIEGDIHRSRKWLSPESLPLLYECENRIELGQGVFQVLYGEALNIA